MFVCDCCLIDQAEATGTEMNTHHIRLDVGTLSTTCSIFVTVVYLRYIPVGLIFYLVPSWAIGSSMEPWGTMNTFHAPSSWAGLETDLPFSAVPGKKPDLLTETRLNKEELTGLCKLSPDDIFKTPDRCYKFVRSVLFSGLMQPAVHRLPAVEAH